MRKLVCFVHSSLDGFAAGPGGEMDWIHVDEEIFDYVQQRTDAASTALYGRVTYEMMENYWPTAGDKPGASKHDRVHSAWYNKVAKVILSHSMKGKIIENTTVISENLETQINDLKRQEGGEIIVFGSPSASHSLMKLHLVDGYWIFVNPILIGKGIPFFLKMESRVPLKLIEVHPFSSGVVCLNYEKIPGS